MTETLKLIEDIHNNAVLHGWWDEPRSYDDVIVLFHSELSEALEEYRAKRPMIYAGHDGKPEGIAVELADYIIRVYDWFGQTNTDPTMLSVGHISVPKQFTKLVAKCHELTSDAYRFGTYDQLVQACVMIGRWLESNGVDTDHVIHMKHDFNRNRPYRHGGKRL